MKNSSKIKSILFYSLFTFGIFMLVTSCADSNAVDSKDIAKQENMDKMSDDDQVAVVIENDDDVKFLMNAAEMQLQQIALGKSSQKRGNAAHVIELGKLLDEEYSRSFAELKGLADKKSVSIPATITQNSKEENAKLEEKNGGDYGKIFSEMVVEEHEKAIKLYEKASTDSKDLEVGAWAAQKLPVLRTLLMKAEACKIQCDKVKS